MPLETARTNGAAYSMYNLLAYSNVAVLANYSGVDVSCAFIAHIGHGLKLHFAASIAARTLDPFR